MAGNDGKPLRADARRNRAHILEVAGAVFAEKGSSASTEEVAARAGVAIGTVFRHFPTKDDLLRAILKDVLARLTGEAESLVDSGAPGTALFTFFRRIVTLAAAQRTVVELLSVSVAEPVQGLRTHVERLLSRAQRAGTVRRDVRGVEVMALLVSACQGAMVGGWDEEIRERTVAIMFDGLRPR